MPVNCYIYRLVRASTQLSYYISSDDDTSSDWTSSQPCDELDSRADLHLSKRPNTNMKSRYIKRHNPGDKLDRQILYEREMLFIHECKM